MFEQFFGLSENPFSLTPDPRFIFASRSHDEALAHLKYWLEHKEGFALITGEVGTGKTTALFRLIDGLERRYEIAFITNSTLSPVDLLEEICRKFGLEVEQGTSKPALLQKLESYLRRQSDRGNGSLLIIDEAQNFEQPLLEEVRLLSNIAKPGGPPLLQIALIGQPELERKLSLPELRQLKQRIGVHYRIEPLNLDETLRYVHHRTGVAGGYPKVLFAEETVSILFDKTHGLPREINQVASQALLAAYVEDSTRVRPEHILGAIKEMSFRSVLEGTKPAAASPPEAPLRTETPARPTVMEVRPMPARVEPMTRDAAAPAPRLMDPPLRPTEPAPIRPAVAAEAPRPEPIHAEAPRVAPPVPTPVPVAVRRPAERPASAASFGSIPPLSKPKVDAPQNEGRANLTRIAVIVGAVAIAGVAGFLLFSPQKPMPDELKDLESEKTMPVDPRTNTATPVTTLPTPSQSANAAGTSAGNPPPANTNPAATNSAAMNSAEMNSAATKSTPTNSSPTNPAATNTPPANPAPAPVVPPPNMASPPPGESTTTMTMAAPTTVANGYRLQVSSLRDSATAVRVGNDLARRSGLPLEIVADRKATGDVWYAVYLGSFPTSEAAAAGRQQFAPTIHEFAEAIIRQPRRH